MEMRLRLGSLLTALFLCLAMTSPAAAVDDTWVGIGGPQEWAPDPGFSLEIGSTAYPIGPLNGGGVRTVALTKPTIVRVRRLPDCRPVVRFVAQPGRDYFIRFAADGTVHVEDWTSEGMDSGPAIDPGPAVCPRLPDTSTSPVPSQRSDDVPVAVIFVLGLVLASLAVARRPRSAR